MTIVESALAAITVQLETDLGVDTVARNRVLPTRIPVGGLVVLHDGEVADWEETIGKGVNQNSVDVQWSASLEVYFEAVDSEERSTGLDVLKKAAIDSVLTDPTLGGLVGTMIARPLALDHTAQAEGGDTRAMAAVAVVFDFETTDPAW